MPFCSALPQLHSYANLPTDGIRMRGHNVAPLAVLLFLALKVGGELADSPGGANTSTVDESSSLRIVGGGSANPHEFPWIVRIQMKGSKGIVCGGSLIREDMVLTAARCLLDQNLDHLEVVAGDHNYNAADEPEQTRNILRGVPHERFSASRLENDIAVLYLQSNVTLTGDKIQLAKLPSASYVPPAAEPAIVAGWGFTSEVATPLSLMKVSVNSVVDPECTKAYGALFTSNLLCYGRLTGFCVGDTGGPLMCGADAVSRVVCGIVSYSNGCAIQDSPGLYTKVSKYLPWIESRKASSGYNGVAHISYSPVLTSLVLIISTLTYFACL